MPWRPIGDLIFVVVVVVGLKTGGEYTNTSKRDFLHLFPDFQQYDLLHSRLFEARRDLPR